MNENFSILGAPAFTEFLKQRAKGELSLRNFYGIRCQSPECIDAEHDARAWKIWLDEQRLGTYTAAYITGPIEKFDFSRKDFPRTYNGLILDESGIIIQREILLNWHNYIISIKNARGKGIVRTTHLQTYRRLDNHLEIPFP